MEYEVVFLYIIAVCCAIFAIFNAVALALAHGKIAKTMGTIVQIQTAVPDTMKKNNSKWATVSYQVGERTYVSQNRVQVSMSSKVGEQVLVRYDINQPSKLYSYSISKILIALLISAVCISIVFAK
ncbi:DUF3592 domain-containing protein [Fusibacter bizertensis]